LRSRGGLFGGPRDFSSSRYCSSYTSAAALVCIRDRRHRSVISKKLSPVSVQYLARSLPSWVLLTDGFSNHPRASYPRISGLPRIEVANAIGLSSDRNANKLLRTKTITKSSRSRRLRDIMRRDSKGGNWVTNSEDVAEIDKEQRWAALATIRRSEVGGPWMTASASMIIELLSREAALTIPGGSGRSSRIR
jgi:hypothetical protein